MKRQRRRKQKPEMTMAGKTEMKRRVRWKDQVKEKKNSKQNEGKKEKGKKRNHYKKYKIAIERTGINIVTLSDHSHGKREFFPRRRAVA